MEDLHSGGGGRCATTVVLPDPEQQPTVSLWPVAANALGIGKNSVYDAAHRGEIPTLRFGGRIVVPTAALRRMLSLDAGPSAA